MEDIHIEGVPDLSDSAISAKSTSDASRTQGAHPVHLCVLIHGLVLLVPAYIGDAHIVAALVYGVCEHAGPFVDFF